MVVSLLNKMATWFGRGFEGSKAITDPSVGFHQSCLNELARSLSQVNKAVDDKVSITIIRLLLYYYYYRSLFFSHTVLY